jgi:hypothetical protein
MEKAIKANDRQTKKNKHNAMPANRDRSTSPESPMFINDN